MIRHISMLMLLGVCLAVCASAVAESDGDKDAKIREIQAELRIKDKQIAQLTEKIR